VRGVIFVAVHQHLRELGDEELRRQCFPEASAYLAFRDYPDADLLRIAQQIALRIPNVAPTIAEVLRSLGEAIPAVLRATAPNLLPKAAGLQGLLEMLDGRDTNPRVVLPRLQASVDEDGRVSLLHTGEPSFCRFDEGLVVGLAALQGDRVVMRHPECRLRKDPRCLFVPRITGEAGRARQSMTIRFAPTGTAGGEKPPG
jgi:hypothetical protein